MSLPRSADAAPDWPEWQRAYVHGTLVVCPSGPVRDTANALRRRYDPVSQTGCEAHITLTQPFLRQPTEAEWRAVEHVLDAFPAFDIDCGPVRSFLPAPVIWLEVQPVHVLLEMRRALHATELFNLALPHTDDFMPHMTITEGRSGPTVTEALLHEIAAGTPGGTFPCSAVDFIAPDTQFRFSVARRLRLRAKES